MRSHAVAVVGLGVISRYYLAALEASPTARLAAVCDRDDAALSPWRDRLPVPAYRDHRELLAAHPSLDGVVVTVPNDAHAAVCADFLRAGVPVCVEKPLALTDEQGAELVALAEVSGTPLFTAFHRRHNTAVTALAARLPSGVPIARVTVRYFERIEEHVGPDRWYLDPARCGGGCVADNGPNAFDLVRLLLGEVTVEGARIRYDEAGLDRQAEIDLRAASGDARATVELDWSYPGELKDVEVVLADGSVHHADMLAGHQGFKASLWHEYEAVLAAFATRLSGPFRPDPGGAAALALVAATYRLARTVSDEPPSHEPPSHEPPSDEPVLEELLLDEALPVGPEPTEAAPC
ncbi:Gfo/Idh/MocA family protein [Streptacidiphilus anmyonensis]|uniref:Gfo/Idh/MocA family protein n=1 Tax=Streptacidiphilus anmyonensis TaxID=405782 RepID=UPI0007C698FF|nr:Gfo/Idh/MocA family oxidoreductase [Streptacidiphilus anmyonensis]